MAKRKALQDEAPTSLDPESEAWRVLPWKKFHRHVYRIQKRIYQASQHGNTRKVQKLQKLLMKSEAARLLAVRRVTQDNQGKRTAGIDGVKSVKPARRKTLAHHIHPKHWKHQKSQPVRRVWIPRPGKNEQRPPGIPTMLNRAKQALAKMALEPEWEAVFEANSYGFRPGRSCLDAKEAILLDIRYKPEYVLDADIKGCFDNIDQEKLLDKMHTYAAMRQAVKGWLKAGVLVNEVFTPTATGTPQGGVVSPLLANMALHGMEELIAQGFKSYAEKPLMVRYADDFVIFHSNKETLEEAKRKVELFLEDMGLYLNARTTRITHTLTPYEGNVGFDFLGFSVRQHTVGKTHSGTYKGRPPGFKTLIKPSNEATKRHTREIKQTLRKYRSHSQEEVIKTLNPKIFGWAGYYRTSIASVIFTECDAILWKQLMQWSRKRLPNKGSHYAAKQYWREVEKRRLVFCTPEGIEIRTHSKTKIERHVKIKGSMSPYDGNLRYWSQRLADSPMFYGRVGMLLGKQQGKCQWCKLTFADEDVIEIDHIDQDRSNNDLQNLRVLHRHCHDERYAKLKEYEERREAIGINHK
jgi:RNA-directed DNA polymerase